MLYTNMVVRLELQPIRYFEWKGKTFQQITSSLKENKYSLNEDDKHNIFLPHPVKLYRREISSQTVSGNSRVSSSIDVMNRPNGYLISESTDSTKCKGLANTLDINTSTNIYDNGGSVTISTNANDTIKCFSQADNARRRLRSSGGMIKKYNIDDRKKNYYTSSNQYLYDRNETFTQNQFTYVVSDPNCATPVAKNKPNNQRFYVQGSVSSSDLIARKKYETITDAASKYQTAYGSAVANALAYGVSDTPYTAKDKAGYPMKKTPVFSKYSTEMKQCTVTKISHAI